MRVLDLIENRDELISALNKHKIKVVNNTFAQNVMSDMDTTLRNHNAYTYRFRNTEQYEEVSDELISRFGSDYESEIGQRNSAIQYKVWIFNEITISVSAEELHVTLRPTL